MATPHHGGVCDKLGVQRREARIFVARGLRVMSHIVDSERPMGRLGGDDEGAFGAVRRGLPSVEADDVVHGEAE